MKPTSNSSQVPDPPPGPRFSIEANVLYSKEALAAELDGLIDVETFLARTNPRKRFKSCYWGADLIYAMNAPLPEEKAAPAPIRRRNSTDRQGAPGRRPTSGPELIDVRSIK